jgi:hypothetical protein
MRGKIEYRTAIRPWPSAFCLINSPSYHFCCNLTEILCVFDIATFNVTRNSTSQENTPDWVNWSGLRYTICSILMSPRTLVFSSFATSYQNNKLRGRPVFFRSVCIRLQVNTVLLTKRPTLTCSPL